MLSSVKYIIIAFAIGVIIITLTLAGMIAFSPYRAYNNFEHKLIKVSVIIEASPARVYTYLGNSSNAKDWSTFVDHITPLNPNEKDDGEQGAIRRCFKNKDESGEIWDEEILVVKENKYRQLSCYNFQNFIMSANNLRTEQIYCELDNGTTELSFTLFFEPGEASWMDKLKMYFAAYEIEAIFEENLENIKHYVES